MGCSYNCAYRIEWAVQIHSAYRIEWAVQIHPAYRIEWAVQIHSAYRIEWAVQIHSAYRIEWAVQIHCAYRIEWAVQIHFAFGRSDLIPVVLNGYWQLDECVPVLLGTGTDDVIVYRDCLLCDRSTTHSVCCPPRCSLYLHP